MVLHGIGVLFFDSPVYSRSLGNSHHFCLFLATFQKKLFLRTLELSGNKHLQQQNNLRVNIALLLCSFLSKIKFKRTPQIIYSNIMTV